MTEKIKVGLMDLLTILLPGAFLLLVFKNVLINPWPEVKMWEVEEEWVKIMAFASVSYVLGHFVYILASPLDTIIFERVRKFIWSDMSLASYVIKLKTELTGIRDRKVINAFKWSCTWLLMKHPNLYYEVERHIAESKFFRSIAVVSLISSLLLFSDYPRFSWALLGLCLLSLVRYTTQRKKSIDLAYISVITASKITFAAGPDPFILYDSTKDINYLQEIREPNPYDGRRFRIWWAKRVITIKKLLAYIRHSLRRYDDIAPSGAPQYKSTEVRWFFDEEKPDLLNWLLSKMGPRNEPEERADMYFVKQGSKYTGIKKRGEGEEFEIKQRVAEFRKMEVDSGTLIKLEAWGKWVLDREESKALKSTLDLLGYKEVLVKKTRWVARIGMCKDGKVEWDSEGKYFETGCMLEYVKLEVNGKYFTGFAAECFGTTGDALQLMRRSGVFQTKNHFWSQVPSSYSEFLEKNFA